MRVLQINKFHYLRAGAESYYFGLSDLLRSHGHQVGHFSMAHPENLATPYAKYFVSNVDYEVGSAWQQLRNAAGIVYSFEARRKLAQLLDDEPFDLTHLHNFHHQISMSILPVLKKRGLAVVYTTHDLKPVCPNYRMLTHDGVCERCRGGKYYYATLHRCTKGSYLKSAVNTVEMYFQHWRGYYDLIDLFITPSAFYRDKFVEFGLPAERVVHVPNFVHVDEFEPQYDPGEYLLYMGRLSAEKGLGTLVEAMVAVPEARLRIAGAGDYGPQVRREIGERGLKNVALLGRKEGDDLRRLLRNCLAVVLPSEWYENGPMSVIEAYATGKPVVGARIGGIPEMVLEGETGYLFEYGDSDDLARAIRTLWERKADVADMGRRCRRRAEEEYDVSRHYERIMEIYERVLNKAGGPDGT